MNMADLLEKAADWLGQVRSAHLARPVTYCRGQSSIDLKATVGQTTFDVTDQYGGIEKWQSRDYLVTATDLVLTGETIQPERGDRIADAGLVFEVLAPGSEHVFKHSDPYGLTLRIHTKEIGS